jgi:RNA polymerase sigma factor (sigma-70 family)
VDYEQLLLDNLPFIDQVIGSIGRRHRLSKHEVDELTSFVHFRLIENDYRVLRRFQQRSLLSTYLVTVVARLFSDYRNARWGRWRPLMAARRLGPVAVLLDRLVSRDGHPVEEAIQVMRITHHVSESEEELRDLWARLPRREADSMVSLDADESEELARPALDESDRDQHAARVGQALRRGAAALTARDRALIRLRVQEDLTLQQLATIEGVHESAMRRRWQRVMKTLRAAFTEAGLDSRDVVTLLETGALAQLSTFLDDDPDAG